MRVCGPVRRSSCVLVACRLISCSIWATDFGASQGSTSMALACSVRIFFTAGRSRDGGGNTQQSGFRLGWGRALLGHWSQR
jgi:hypothetical protein